MSATCLLLAEIAQIKGNTIAIEGSDRATFLHKGPQGGGH
jgi:hypothetical protein